MTKLLHLLKVDSLGYKNQKLMLWGFGIHYVLGPLESEPLEPTCSRGSRPVLKCFDKEPNLD